MSEEKDTRYVNRDETPDGDPRVDGPVGKVLGGTQRALSVQTPEPPKVAKHDFKGGGHIALSWSQGTPIPLPFFSLFIPRKPDADGTQRYRSFRIGWRWDSNWGDGNNPAEPKVEKPGGYIADVIWKSTIDNEVQP